ncbi:MAG: hydrolase or metal-binding protein, partial [Pseudomonas sp.]|nr:hydrolase or metal-binding protein [Pseudomonas sp.]
RGFSNGAFEDSEEDSGAVIEEFFSSTDAASINAQSEAPQPSPNSLAGKLEVLATQTH